MQLPIPGLKSEKRKVKSTKVKGSPTKSCAMNGGGIMVIGEKEASHNSSTNFDIGSWQVEVSLVTGAV